LCVGVYFKFVKYLRSKYSRAGCACLPAGRSVAKRERANICEANIRELVVPACRQAGLWPSGSEQIVSGCKLQGCMIARLVGKDIW